MDKLSAYSGNHTHGHSPKQGTINLTSIRLCDIRYVNKPATQTQNTQNSSDVNNMKQINDNVNNEAFVGEILEDNRDVTGFSEFGNTAHQITSDETFTTPFLPSMPDSDMKHISDILSRYHRFGAYNQEQHYIKPLADVINAMPTLDKLRGFVGFSGTFNIKLTWNTDPTMLGMFLVAYVPPGCGVPTGTSAFGKQTFYSGCPHVIVNIAETTSAILSIPYVGESNVIPLYPTQVPLDLSNRRYLGNIHIVPIIALASALSPNAINMSLFINIENLKTYGVQPRTAVVEASAALAGIVEATRKSKIVSSTFGNISKYLNANHDTGFVGGLSRAGGWAFGAASKISDLLGWSKPLDVQNLLGVVQLPYRDLYTCDTTFVGAKASHNYDQGISDLDLSGRSVDEMTIAAIVDRPNIIPNVSDIQDPTIGHMSMAKSFPEGTLIGSIPIGPDSYQVVSTDSSYVYTSSTQISYISKLFEFWRGAIRIYVRPVCTKFHSARIRVVFIPGDKVTDTEMIINTMQYTYAHVVDIRDANTYDVEIPFVHTFPWRRTGNSIGYLYFFVENPLIAPENVSDTIYFPLFVSGGQDFELTVPIIKHVGVPSPVLSIAHVESYEGMANIVNMAPNTTSDSVTAHSMSIGDPVRSMRAVLKRFWPAGSFGTNITKFYLSSEPSSRHVSASPTNLQRDLTMFTTWLYGFHRGGMRWYAQNYYPARISTVSQVTSDSFTETGVGQSQDSNIQLVQTITLGATDTAKIEIPYYNPSVCVNHWIRGNTNSSGLLYDYWTGATTGSVFCRALADDFSFGFLVGAPTVVTST